MKPLWYINNYPGTHENFLFAVGMALYERLLLVTFFAFINFQILSEKIWIIINKKKFTTFQSERE